ncbi:MAG TPA: hypothetical protein VF544_24315 [Pyrinomonadaceae bacterium]
MNTSYLNSGGNRVVVMLLSSIALLLALSSSVWAQRLPQRTLPDNVPRQRDPTAQVRAQEIEASRTPRDPQLIMAEVNEDFGRLRAVDEELKLASTAAAAGPDYKQVASSSTEAKKRATRLKANLVFPQPPKNENRPKSPDMEGDEFTILLAAMQKRLNSFLTNPIFSDTGGVDAQLATRARYDLEDIIKLSDKLRKSAEKMSKR